MKRLVVFFLMAALLLPSCGTREEMRVISWGPVFSQMTEAEILAYFEHCTGLEAEDYMEDYGGLYLDGGRPVLLFRRDSDVIGMAKELLPEDSGLRIEAARYTDAELEAVNEWLGGVFPYLGDFVMRETKLDVIGNCIEISVEVGTDITAFTEALLSALDMPDVDAGIFRIREFDPADEVYYMTGND